MISWSYEELCLFGLFFFFTCKKLAMLLERCALPKTRLERCISSQNPTETGSLLAVLSSLKLQVINTVTGTEPGRISSTLTLLWGFPSCPSVCVWMRKWSGLGTVPVFVFIRVFSVWIISPFWFIPQWCKWSYMGRKDGTGAGINRQRVDLLFLAPVLASAY